ncbi:hypothetical protein MMC08_008149, partial [Hypocenomyce scalaris]|nr:hypothetical protein [Hypocenomyce scalaris]
FLASSIDSTTASHLPPRPASPSLHTYGTFGSIQRSLASSNNVFTPAASAEVEGQSDLFVSAIQAKTKLPAATSEAVSNQVTVDTYVEWPIDSFDPLSPQALEIASGWADGTFDFSLAQPQFDWADQSLSLDADYDWMYSSLEEHDRNTL